jgi:hypothetical protein
MIGDPGKDIRTAIYNRLNGAVRTVVSNAVIPIYSYITYDKDYPFIWIEPIVEDKFEINKDGADIHDIKTNIHLITGPESDEGDFQEIETPMSTILSLLGEFVLTLTNYNCLLGRFESSTEVHEQTDTHSILRKQLTMHYILEHK